MRTGILHFTYLGKEYSRNVELLEDNHEPIYYQEMAHEWLKDTMHTCLAKEKKEGIFPQNISLKVDGEIVFETDSFAKP